MRSKLAVSAAAVAVWLGSPALNSAYVPWGTSGASGVFVGAAAIWLISTFLLIVTFQRSDVETRGFALTLVAIIGFLVLAESLFWFTMDENNNKPMLLRLSVGTDVGLVAVGVAAIVTLWPGPVRRFQWLFAHCARWTAKVIAGAITFELALFVFRTLFRRTLGYYAMDCAMFAIAALSVAIALAALCRCSPVNGREADRA